MKINQQKCVIQVLPALNSGGVERGTLEMADYLIKKNWKSVVISSGGKLENRLTRNGSTHITLPVHRKNPFRWPKLKSDIEKVFLEQKPNIIHVRSRVPAWTAGKVAMKMKIPLVSTIHGSYTANSFINFIDSFPNNFIKSTIDISLKFEIDLYKSLAFFEIFNELLSKITSIMVSLLIKNNFGNAVS